MIKIKIKRGNMEGISLTGNLGEMRRSCSHMPGMTTCIFLFSLHSLTVREKQVGMDPNPICSSAP